MIFEINLIMWNIFQFLHKDEKSLLTCRRINKISNEIISYQFPDLTLSKWITIAKKIKQLNKSLSVSVDDEYPDDSHDSRQTFDITYGCHIHLVSGRNGDCFLKVKSKFDFEQGSVVYYEKLSSSFNFAIFYRNVVVPPGFSKIGIHHHFTIFDDFRNDRFLIVDFTDLENKSFHLIPKIHIKSDRLDNFFGTNMETFPDLTKISYLDIDVLYRTKIPSLENNIDTKNSFNRIYLTIENNTRVLISESIDKNGMGCKRFRIDLPQNFYFLAMERDFSYGVFGRMKGETTKELILLKLCTNEKYFHIYIPDLIFTGYMKISNDIACIIFFNEPHKNHYFYLCNIPERRWVRNIYNNIKLLENQFLQSIRISETEAVLLCDSNCLPFKIKINLKSLTIV